MAKTALSFYHWSKEVGQNGKNGVILRPEVEGCEGERKDGEEKGGDDFPMGEREVIIGAKEGWSSWKD